jgi:hypothetical protein
MGRDFDGWFDHQGDGSSRDAPLSLVGGRQRQTRKKEGCPPAGGRGFLFASERLKQASSLASKKKSAR